MWCSGSRAESRRTSASGGADAPAATDAATGVGSFELVDEAAPAAARHRGSPPAPLTPDEWASHLDGAGRLRDPAALWRRVYGGGVAPELRAEVWKFVLGVYDLDSCGASRAARARDLVERYERLAQQWRHIDVEQAAHWAKWRERRSQVCTIQPPPLHSLLLPISPVLRSPRAELVSLQNPPCAPIVSAVRRRSGRCRWGRRALGVRSAASARAPTTWPDSNCCIMLAKTAAAVQVEKDVVRTDRDAPLFSATDAPALGVMHRVLLSYIMFNQDLGYSQARL